MINQNLGQYIDHTNLSLTATKSEIEKLCAEAKQYNFKSVCIHPQYVEYAKQCLKTSNVLVCTVIGFPLGQNTTQTKVQETIDAIHNGADEIDMVINLSLLKANDFVACINEINKVVENANNKTVKVIVETCQLSYQEKILAWEIVSASKAHFIKTSTGFSTGGAQIEDIQLWSRLNADHNKKLNIKASGGIKTAKQFKDFIDAGANRIGTSNGISLVSNVATKASGY